MNGCISGWMRSSSSRTHAHALAAQYLHSLNEEENKLVFPAFPALAGGKKETLANTGDKIY